MSNDSLSSLTSHRKAHSRGLFAFGSFLSPSLSPPLCIHKFWDSGRACDMKRFSFFGEKSELHRSVVVASTYSTYKCVLYPGDYSKIII